MGKHPIFLSYKRGLEFDARANPQRAPPRGYAEVATGHSFTILLPGNIPQMVSTHGLEAKLVDTIKYTPPPTGGNGERIFLSLRPIFFPFSKYGSFKDSNYILLGPGTRRHISH